MQIIMQCYRSKRIREAMFLLLGGMLLTFLATCPMQKKQEKSILIAVLDTGYNGENQKVRKIGDVYDLCGHGTKLTELLATLVEENVTILPIKITDGYGQAMIEDVKKGLNEAQREQADIILFSLTVETAKESASLKEMIKTTTEQGAYVVVPAGNFGIDTEGFFPANLKEALVVSAVDVNQTLCAYSNYGKQIDFSAYGDYQGEQGTSFAAARVCAMLANELAEGKTIDCFIQKAIDLGTPGWDIQYGYGMIETGETQIKENQRKEQKIAFDEKKSSNDLEEEIMNLSWREEDAQALNAYFAETNPAYVGMFLDTLSHDEQIELEKKADILQSKVLVQVFEKEEGSLRYQEVEAYEENFAEHAIKEYRSIREKLTVSAEYLILQKPTGEFVISSENRENIYYYEVSGFSYRTDTPDSSYFQMFDPATLVVTRTTVKENNPAFTAPYVTGMNKYLTGASGFGIMYKNTETGALVEEKNFRAIEFEADTGHRQFGLSITMGGYASGRVGYHTSEEDIVQIPYNYQHIYPQYTYEAYKEPLTYYFGKETGLGEVEWMSEPQRVGVQPKSFKTLIPTNGYTVYFSGIYRDGYNYTNLDYSLPLANMMAKYLKQYKRRMMNGVYILSSKNSISGNSFTINFSLNNSMGIQWNNGESTTKVIKNDIPEYNFPLVINTYTIRYHGNGAAYGSMADMPMTYQSKKALTKNGYGREGYLFLGWATTSNGPVVYQDEAMVMNLTTEHQVIVDLYAVWEPIRYQIGFHGNGATVGGMGALQASYNQSVALTPNAFLREGYRFIGWSDTRDGEVKYADGAVVRNLTKVNGTTINLYAVWKPISYTIVFDANGGEGTMLPIDATYDMPVILPENGFYKQTAYGACVWMGYSTSPLDSNPVFLSGDVVMNLKNNDGGVVILYAVWDEPPWIEAKDLYFSLEDARQGRITENLLLQYARAMDKEAGGMVQPGVDDEKKTEFCLLDYSETDFTQLNHEGSVTETYQVTDRVHTSYKKRIFVHVVDTETIYQKPETITRFIGEKYYEQSKEQGGLERDSIWRTDAAYQMLLKQAFENSKNNTPVKSFYFTRDEILARKNSIP